MNYITYASIMTPRYRKVEEPTEPPAPEFLLDTYTTARVAYSLEKLKSSATHAIKVKNNSNEIAEIGFDENNKLDTAALLSHCGTGNGRVIWHDQTGNGNEWTPPTGSEPLIVENGNLITFDGKPAVRSTGTQTLVTSLSGLTSTTCDYSVVGVSASNAFTILGSGNNTSNYYFTAQDGSSSTTLEGNAGTPQYFINGTEIVRPATREDLHSAIAGTGLKMLSVINADLSSWSALSLKYPAGAVAPIDYMMEKILFDNDNNMAEIQTEINNRYL